MSDERRCPVCGSELTDGEPAGPCPACRPREGRPDPGPVDPAPGRDRTASLGPAAAGDVATLAESLDGRPRLLLRDPDPETGPTPGERPDSPAVPPAADRADRYQVFGDIARGGMGAVLKGRDPDLWRDLAVKVLLERHRDDPDLVERLVEEAQIGGQLQHLGVVPVYELGAFADRSPRLPHQWRLVH
jgi:hypothetical protein